MFSAAGSSGAKHNKETSLDEGFKDTIKAAGKATMGYLKKKGHVLKNIATIANKANLLAFMIFTGTTETLENNTSSKYILLLNFHTCQWYLLRAGAKALVDNSASEVTDQELEEFIKTQEFSKFVQAVSKYINLVISEQPQSLLRMADSIKYQSSSAAKQLELIISNSEKIKASLDLNAAVKQLKNNVAK